MSMKTLQPVITYRHSSLQDADNTLNTILDLIVEGTWDWNSQTGEVLRSPGWYRMLGYEVGVLKQDVLTWENIIHPEDYTQVMHNFELYTGGQIDRYCIDYRCKKADDSYLWITDRALTVVHNPDGSVARIIGAHQDIHERKVAQMELIEQNRLLKAGNVTLEKSLRKKAEELEKRNAELQEKIAQIEHISNTDSLTQIANRKRFEEVLIQERSRANRYRHPLSLAIFDIDHFKKINDRYGHKVGDGVLQNLTKMISDNIRDIDFFARWGGEEFVLIFPDVTLDGAMQAANKLRQLVSEQEMMPGLTITCSFGVTEYQPGDSIEHVFARIDNALYMAKNAGRNRVERIASTHHKA